MTLKRIRTEDPSMSLIQDYVDQALTPLQNGALSTAQLLTAVSIASVTGSPVAHKLGHTPVIWLVGNLNANAVVFQYQKPDATFLYLQASAPVTGNIVVK